MGYELVLQVGSASEKSMAFIEDQGEPVAH
jgi:hypothetical protein